MMDRVLFSRVDGRSVVIRASGAGRIFSETPVSIACFCRDVWHVSVFRRAGIEFSVSKADGVMKTRGHGGIWRMERLC